MIHYLLLKTKALEIPCILDIRATEIWRAFESSSLGCICIRVDIYVYVLAWHDSPTIRMQM